MIKFGLALFLALTTYEAAYAAGVTKRTYGPLCRFIYKVKRPGMPNIIARFFIRTHACMVCVMESPSKGH